MSQSLKEFTARPMDPSLNPSTASVGSQQLLTAVPEDLKPSCLQRYLIKCTDPPTYIQLNINLYKQIFSKYGIIYCYYYKKIT